MVGSYLLEAYYLFYVTEKFSKYKKLIICTGLRNTNIVLDIVYCLGQVLRKVRWSLGLSQMWDPHITPKFIYKYS
jgi:hypothetical protein